MAGISARIRRTVDSLEVRFSLEGDLDRLLLPAPVPVRRSERLWQHTCFEAFIAERMPAYREFNFSPSGEWAAYEFAAYREGANALDCGCSVSVERGPGRLVVEAQIPLAGRARLGLSAVIESADGALSYWALRHPPGRPDFHHPDALSLELDAVRS